MPKILISTLHPIRQRPAGPYLCLPLQYGSQTYRSLELFMLVQNQGLGGVRGSNPCSYSTRTVLAILSGFIPYNHQRADSAERQPIAISLVATCTATVRVHIVSYLSGSIQYGTSTSTSTVAKFYFLIETFKSSLTVTVIRQIFNQRRFELSSNPYCVLSFGVFPRRSSLRPLMAHTAWYIHYTPTVR